MKYAISLLLAAAAGLANAAAYAEALTWDPRVVLGVLPNGMHYRIVDTPDARGQIDLRLSVLAGSLDEHANEVGVAHLVEHLSFYNRDAEGKTVRERLHNAGWRQGEHFNAVTNYERTQYRLSPPQGAAQLGLALSALAQLAGPATFDGADLAAERPVVLAEWREGLGTFQRMNAQRVASQRHGSAYPAHSPIGSQTAIETAAIGTLQRFQRRWYHPNNALLTLVGDVRAPAALDAITRQFGQQAHVPLPQKGNRELPLATQPKAFRLQDSQSGSRQVGLLYRLLQPAASEPSSEGLRQRLIDRLAAKATLRLLQELPPSEQAKSFSMQTVRVGRDTKVVGFAVSPVGNQHREALRQLMVHIERIRRYGYPRALVDELKNEVHEVAVRMQQAGRPMTLRDWVVQLDDAERQQLPLASRAQRARLSVDALASIDGETLRARFAAWVGAADQVVQFTAPPAAELALPTAAELAQWRGRLASLPLQRIAYRVQATPTQPDALVANATQGAIVERQMYAAEQVVRWHLSNGDTVFWLQKKATGGGVDLRIDSPAGYTRAVLPAVAQLATSLYGRAAAGWGAPRTQVWKNEHAVQLDYTHHALRLEAQGHAPAGGLANLLQLYHHQQTAQTADSAGVAALQEKLRDAQARAPSINDIQHRDWAELADETNELPAPEALSEETLRQAWRATAGQPVTYYLMGDLPPKALETLVAQELATISRARPAPRWQAAPLAIPARQQSVLAIGIEPRAQLKWASFSPGRWTPEEAAQVSLLSELAQRKLKAQLRDTAKGVYSLTFTSTFSPEHQRVESMLSLRCAPERLDALVALAHETLRVLPEELNAEQVNALKRRLQHAEAQRRTDPATQLQRLQLSVRQYGDPRYLLLQHSLADAVTLPSLQSAAARLFDENHVLQQRTLPAPAEMPATAPGGNRGGLPWRTAAPRAEAHR